jgi:LysR family glycine cleavage system transcriptional activator
MSYTLGMSALPPLNAVRVFEAVARHGNLTRAAAELNMTQSAVSYQVKLLETFLGSPLFVREARGVTLTAKGRELAPVADRALGDLRRSLQRLRGAADTTLTISTMQTMASNWLAPRLGHFQDSHPEIAVRIHISAELVDFDRDDVDVAIRSGRGGWPGLASHLMIAQVFMPFASPAYLAREGRPATPVELLKHVLISPSDPWWEMWFAAAGVAMPARIPRPGLDVETQAVAATVAAAGHGVTLATPGFIPAEIAEGRLLPLFDVTATANSNYYLVYPEDRRSQRKIALFRDWVLAEAAQH